MVQPAQLIPRRPLQSRQTRAVQEEQAVWVDVIIGLLCRINTKTGEVSRDALFEGQNLDHPRVNPNFYSRPTRYVYFNAAKPMDHPGNSGPRLR